MLQMKMRQRCQWLSLLVASLASAPAIATLGEPDSSASTSVPAQTNAARATALRAKLGGNSVSVRVVLQDDGITIQEYSNGAGVVFAVAWNGPGFPDLKSLLGKYFGTYKAATELPGQPRTLGGSVQFERPGLVVRTSGRMRAFVGLAVATDLLPPGVVVDDLLP